MEGSKRAVSGLDLPEKALQFLTQKWGITHLHPPQFEAMPSVLSGDNTLLAIPTASGKSLIIYLLCRWYEGEMSLPNCKTIIIVPTTSLVEQMGKDFKEYGYDKDVCKIYSGQPVFSADITISTWQSFAKAPKEVLQGFDVVIGDEAHLFKAQTLKGILEKM